MPAFFFGAFTFSVFPARFLSNAHTLQTQTDRLAQHGGDFPAPSTIAQHRRTAGKQCNLKHSLLRPDQFDPPFPRAPIVAQTI